MVQISLGVRLHFGSFLALDHIMLSFRFLRFSVFVLTDNWKEVRRDGSSLRGIGGEWNVKLLYLLRNLGGVLQIQISIFLKLQVPNILTNLIFLNVSYNNFVVFARQLVENSRV